MNPAPFEDPKLNPPLIQICFWICCIFRSGNESSIMCRSKTESNLNSDLFLNLLHIQIRKWIQKHSDPEMNPSPCVDPILNPTWIQTYFWICCIFRSFSDPIHAPPSVVTGKCVCVHPVTALWRLRNHQRINPTQLVGYRIGFIPHVVMNRLIQLEGGEERQERPPYPTGEEDGNPRRRPGIWKLCPDEKQFLQSLFQMVSNHLSCVMRHSSLHMSSCLSAYVLMFHYVYVLMLLWICPYSHVHMSSCFIE